MASRSKSNKQQASPQKSKSPSIYIGPNLPGGALYTNTVFRAGVLPAHLQALIAKVPAILDLIVPVENRSASIRRINVPGNRLYIARQALVEQIKEAQHNAV